MHKKRPKICTGCRVREAKIYLYHSTKIAKARPHREEWQTDSSVQKQWFMPYLIFFLPLFAYLLCLDVKDANLRVRSLIAKYIFVFRTISTTRGTTYETTLVTAIVT